MAEPQQIRFVDGASYETMMGVWSRLAGEVFLDWVEPSAGWRWVDVGCGNGVFTELVAARHSPAEIEGIDPSEAQIAYAQKRPGVRLAHFQQGDAMALPFAEGQFDAAIMALVIFFVPDQTRGVAEMARVVRPGGVVAAYAWDMEGGGFPFEPLRDEMRAMGLNPAGPPYPEAARLDRLRAFWTANGLVDIETREITVERRFDSFDNYWDIAMTTPGFSASLAGVSDEDRAAMKARLRARLAPDAVGSFAHSARAHAVKGRTHGVA
jgi:SAM-dependent methyltransferase